MDLRCIAVAMLALPVCGQPQVVDAPAKLISKDDAVRIANNSQYGLSGAVWGTDVDRAVAVARRIRTGQIAVNGFGPGGAPFGGFKQSGFGRESGGIIGILQYMEPKAMGLPV